MTQSRQLLMVFYYFLFQFLIDRSYFGMTESFSMFKAPELLMVHLSLETRPGRVSGSLPFEWTRA